MNVPAGRYRIEKIGEEYDYARSIPTGEWVLLDDCVVIGFDGAVLTVLVPVATPTPEAALEAKP